MKKKKTTMSRRAVFVSEGRSACSNTQCTTIRRSDVSLGRQPCQNFRLLALTPSQFTLPAPLKHTVGWGPGKATVEDLMRHKEEVRLKKLGQQHVVLEQVVQQPGQAVINSMEQAPSYHSFDLLDLWNTASSDHQGVWPALPYNQHPAALGAGLSGETPSTDHDATPRPSQDAGHGQPTRPKLTVLTALDGKPARGVAISRGQPNGGWVGARSWYPPRLTRDQSDGQHQQQHSTAHSSVSSTAFSFQSAASAMSTGRTDAHAVPSASAVAMPRQYGAHFEPPSEILSYEHHPITRAWDRERERQQLTAPTYKEVTAPHTYVSPSPAPLWHQSPSGQATMQDRDREQDDDRVHGFRNAGLEIRGHVDHRYPPPARGIAHGRP